MLKHGGRNKISSNVNLTRTGHFSWGWFNTAVIQSIGFFFIPRLLPLLQEFTQFTNQHGFTIGLLFEVVPARNIGQTYGCGQLWCNSWKFTWCCKKLWWIWDYCNISSVRWQQWICSTLDSVFNIEVWIWRGSLKLDFSGNQNMSISRVSNDRSQSWVNNVHVTPSIPSVHMARARFSSAE